MSTWLVPTDFASLTLAIASPSVQNGDDIVIEAGFTNTLPATTSLTINKNVSIFGQNKATSVIRTAGLTSDPATMFTISNDVTFTNLTITHAKGSNTGTERIFNSTGNLTNRLSVINCDCEHLEFCCVGSYRRLEFIDCNVFVNDTLTLANVNTHFSLTGSTNQGMLFRNVTFDAYQASPQTRFITLSSGAPPSVLQLASNGDSTIILDRCVHNGIGQLAQGFAISRFDNFGTGKLNLVFTNNNWNVYTGLGNYRFQSVNNEVNLLNNINNIIFKNCSHDQSVSSGSQCGILSISGSGTSRSIGSIAGTWVLCYNNFVGNITAGTFSQIPFTPSTNQTAQFFARLTASFQAPPAPLNWFNCTTNLCPISVISQKKYQSHNRYFHSNI